MTDFDWRMDAACRHHDPELWLTPRPPGMSNRDPHTEARNICARCPSRVPCLDYALRTGQTDGVWGGYDVDERAIMIARSVKAGDVA